MIAGYRLIQIGIVVLGLFQAFFLNRPYNICANTILREKRGVRLFQNFFIEQIQKQRIGWYGS